MAHRYWISFDLGLQGDYEPLYSWLDQQDYKEVGDREGARECGDSVATFISEKSRDAVAREIKSRLGKQQLNARIYVISLDKGGRFVVGSRKLPPWKGYAAVESDSGDER
jgi:hypothetical protein